MIIDLTESFFEEAAHSRTSYNQSNWHASNFLKNSTSYLADLNLLDTKLGDIEKRKEYIRLEMRSGGRFQKESLSIKITNLKQHLKTCEQNIKRLKSQSVDIRSHRQMAQKLKESILIAMQLRLLTATFRFKDIHLTFAKSNRQTSKSQRQINLSRSHFLEPNQKELLEEVNTKEYNEIQKSIYQISQMYRQTMHVVRMQELMIDSIEGHIDDADENVQGGRKNLSELNSKEQKNRRFIIKVFGVLYFIVFFYLVVLS